MAQKNDRPGRILWDWRKFFTRNTLQEGQKDLANDKLHGFTIGTDGKSAMARTENGFDVRVLSIPDSYEAAQDYPRWDQLDTYRKSSPRYFAKYYYCSCSQGNHGTRCRHLANLMLQWERIHGPFLLEESEEEYRARIEREKAQRERAQKEKMVFLVCNALPRLEAPYPLYFQPEAIMRNTEIKTNQYEIDESERLCDHTENNEVEMSLFFDRAGDQTIQADGTIEGHKASIVFDQTDIRGMRCDCGRCTFQNYWYSDDPVRGMMCAHALTLWRYVRGWILDENPGDDTDYRGQQLLNMMTDQSPRIQAVDEPQAEKQTNITLSPRIVQDRYSDEVKLTFDVGHTGGRLYALKGFEKLVEAADKKEAYPATAKVTLDFSKEDFSEDSKPWYQLIVQQVRAIAQVNARLSNSGYYYGGKLAVGNSIALAGRELDSIYDMTEGSHITFQYGNRTDTTMVPVGPAMPRATMTVTPIRTKKQVTGIRISGTIPRFLEGSQHQYILDREAFGRVSEDSMGLLKPFNAISDREGHFNCVLGEKKFAEFYYRVLPRLRESRQIELTDKVSNVIAKQVPPEPEFTFYIDIPGDITCRAEVDYDGQVAMLGYTDETLIAARRDMEQERRVLSVVGEFFPERNDAKKEWTAPNDDDTLVAILTRGVAALSAYGVVKGSDAFRQVHIKPMAKPSVSLRVEGGLLDLSIQTKDYSSDELLDLLNSYKLKKRWHRLKNGDFVDLTDATAFDELMDTVETLDISPEKLIKEGAHVPKYRALYVDKLLETHNDIAASRDRQFKALVRSFQTIRDSDFEVSESLKDVLRAYQVYGFRWLNTLSASGFGGILADEMGLGKTLQLLAFLEGQREAGETRPSLVVCPASLVYNWREECRRFTPNVTVQTLDGTLPARKKLFEGMKSEDHALLYVTSYDLLKRDITFYDDVTFATVALDEAQYVKNQKTAVSRAVRVLKAEHRFALTGTPIENRLAELWSIFDFLMPGFLYSAPEFQTRFENPIMKQGDKAMTARLSRMTEPFILRRKKQDVLKDLPEKLEETRASAMEPDQRRLYDAQVVHMKEMLQQSDDSSQSKMRILAEITRLRQLCCDPSLIFENYEGTSAKRAACLELIQNAIDGGHRMLVFSQFTSMLALLQKDLEAQKIPFYTITGATSKQDRLKLVNQFNEGDVPVFLISLKAGGTGLNLTGADVVIHYDPWWNLAVQNQATDRAHRIGQTKQVTVIRLIAAETIEEKIIQLQEAKRELAESIISSEGGSLMSFTRDELLALLG